MKATDTWLRRFHPAPEPKTRLACFPYAGGSASFYFPLSLALHPGVEVLGVQYPGRQDRSAEALIDDIGELAERSFTALLPWMDRPLALFGHSMGALVAYEVAARMEREGAGPPVRLFVSALGAPSLRRPAAEPVHLRDDDRLIALMRELGGASMSALGDEFLRLMLPVVRNDYRAYERYIDLTGGLLNAPITAFAGDADPLAAVAEISGWRAHTAGAFDMEILTGGHFFLSDHIADVARGVTDRLGRRHLAVVNS